MGHEPCRRSDQQAQDAEADDDGRAGFPLLRARVLHADDAATAARKVQEIEHSAAKPTGIVRQRSCLCGRSAPGAGVHHLRMPPRGETPPNDNPSCPMRRRAMAASKGLPGHRMKFEREISRVFQVGFDT